MFIEKSYIFKKVSFPLPCIFRLFVNNCFSSSIVIIYPKEKLKSTNKMLLKKKKKKASLTKNLRENCLSQQIWKKKFWCKLSCFFF